MKITKESVLGRVLQSVLVLGAIVIMYLGGLTFFVASFTFYFIGGIFEDAIMRTFSAKKERKLTKQEKKIKNAFLWVHQNVNFIKKYNTTIYNFKHIGV